MPTDPDATPPTIRVEIEIEGTRSTICVHGREPTMEQVMFAVRGALAGVGFHADVIREWCPE